MARSDWIVWLAKGIAIGWAVCFVQFTKGIAISWAACFVQLKGMKTNKWIRSTFWHFFLTYIAKFMCFCRISCLFLAHLCMQLFLPKFIWSQQLWLHLGPKAQVWSMLEVERCWQCPIQCASELTPQNQREVSMVPFLRVRWVEICWNISRWRAWPALFNQLLCATTDSFFHIGKAWTRLWKCLLYPRVTWLAVSNCNHPWVYPLTLKEFEFSIQHNWKPLDLSHQRRHHIKKSLPAMHGVE